MNPSGRGKLAVPYRSPDGVHCSRGCKWLFCPSWTEPKCLMFGGLKRDYSIHTGRRIRRRRECLRYGRLHRPTIVCLCGSTRFYKAFQEAYFRETMRGLIVLSVGFYPDMKDGEHGEERGITPGQKLQLDRLHKMKIDMADEILVLNVGGYVGDSTASEIEHARKRGKRIRWLEPVEVIL